MKRDSMGRRSRKGQRREWVRWKDWNLSEHLKVQLVLDPRDWGIGVHLQNQWFTRGCSMQLGPFKLGLYFRHSLGEP